MQADRGFAFVKLDTHEHAAMAIVQLQGQMVHGRPIKCSWGKDRADGGAPAATPVTPTTAAAAPYGNIPMYGMPQPSAYGQYGFAGYTGFPGQAAAPGAPGSPGMSQAAGAAAPGLGLNVGGQQPGADLTGANPAQQSQPQWGATDPNYYSGYWGGYYSQQAAAPGGQQPTGDAMPGQSA